MASEKSVLRAVRKLDEPTTSAIKERVPAVSGGSVSAILKVLERRGFLFSSKGQLDGRGRPPTVWEETASGPISRDL
mgnify:CR=1 FL=1